MDNMNNVDNVNNVDELDNIVVLNDEYGNDVPFEFLDLVTYNEKEYVVLLPVEESEEADVVILRVEASDSDPDMENYLPVEDEDTLAAVFEVFKERFQEAFTFED